jgi:3'(2'), 5'-bisphosphate nucleotidase
MHMVFNRGSLFRHLETMSEYLELMTRLAREAGGSILDIYGESDFGIEIKQDNSPLTRADLAAHKIIVAGLEKEVPDVPILSEESTGITWQERKNWDRYFLIDPLDGTKEFISRNGEFTVNIAYVENGIPTSGVVYVPVKDVMYTGDQSKSQAAVERDGQSEIIGVRKMDPKQPLTIVASRRHGGEALQTCLDVLKRHFDEVETTNMGSSLKLCLIAEGKADLYPRLAPTSEWDTAAAQAVVEAAGGRVVDVELNPLVYNSKEDILNPYFYVLGDPDFDWLSILDQVRFPSP